MMIFEEVDHNTLVNMRLALEETCRRSTAEKLQTHEARTFIARAIFEGVQHGDRSFSEMLLTGQKAVFQSDAIRAVVTTTPVDAVEARPGFEPR